MIDKPFIEQFIRKEFRDEICDETKANELLMKDV